MRTLLTSSLLLIALLPAVAQEQRAPHLPDHSEQLKALAFLVGSYEGGGRNQIGAYDERFTGEWDVNKTVLTVRSASTMDEMIVFEDLRVFSYDNEKDRIRMRQWAMGDLITYDVKVEEGTLICTETEHEGKGRGKWRYTLKPDRGGIQYTLEEAGNDGFAPYVKGSLVPSPSARGNNKSVEGAHRIAVDDELSLVAYVSVPEGPGPHPVIVFSPGGQAESYRGYEGFTRWFSSWGFACVTVAFNDSSAEVRAGKFGLVADWLTTQNAAEDSPLHARLDLTKLGAAGHSRGGYGALLVCAKDKRFMYCLALAPSGPDKWETENDPAVCIVAGDDDADTARDVYGQVKGPRLMVIVEGMDHFLQPTSSMMHGLSRAQAFLNWRVLGDQRYAQLAKKAQPGVAIESAD